MKRTTNILMLCIAAWCLLTAFTPRRAVTIFLIGDSTMANKDTTNGKQDNTHYNVYGATIVARLLADALCEEVPALRKHRMKKP